MVDQAITHIPINQLADWIPNGADAIGTLIWLKNLNKLQKGIFVLMNEFNLSINLTIISNTANDKNCKKN